MIGWKPSPFIFVHIPKCAGTSIEQALLPVATPRNEFGSLTVAERQQFWLPGPHKLQHAKLRRYAQHFPLRYYFKFAFVRNPWERAISQIEYLRAKHVKVFESAGNIKDSLRIYCQSKREVIGQDFNPHLPTPATPKKQFPLSCSQVGLRLSQAVKKVNDLNAQIKTACQIQCLKPLQLNI